MEKTIRSITPKDQAGRKLLSMKRAFILFIDVIGELRLQKKAPGDKIW